MSNEEQSSSTFLLWGGKSKARIINEMIREQNLGEVKFIYDETLENTTFPTDALFINDAKILNANLASVNHYIVCIGGEFGYARYKTAKYLEAAGLKTISIIHKESFIDPTAIIGMGCQIMPCAVIHKFVEVGQFTIINTNATIDHECIIGNGVHVMGSAALTGKIVVEDYATIGTNSTVLPNIRIGEGALVGAGAVVTKDVPAYTVVAGVPARIVKNTKPAFHEESLKKIISTRNF